MWQPCCTARSHTNPLTAFPANSQPVNTLNPPTPYTLNLSTSTSNLLPPPRPLLPCLLAFPVLDLPRIQLHPPNAAPSDLPLLVSTSGKLDLIDKMCVRLKERGHRVLIYSQFTRMMDILEDWLLWRRWGYQRIDGNVPGVNKIRRTGRESRESLGDISGSECQRGSGTGAWGVSGRRATRVLVAWFKDHG